LDSSLDHQAWSTSGIHGKGPLDPNSDRELQLGDEIFFSGLFYPHGGATRNIPIVRVGNMSALREEPVLSRNNELMDVYLVEARSISGLSGCPVFIDLAALKRARQPSGGLMAAGSEMQPVSVRFRLIGVMHGHFGSDDYPSPSNSLDGSSTALQLNFGIAMVIPSEKVLEVLEDFATPPDKPA